MLPITGQELYEELVINSGKAIEVFYHAHTGQRVEILPGESKIVIRSRRNRRVKKWYGKRQIIME